MKLTEAYPQLNRLSVREELTDEKDGKLLANGINIDYIWDLANSEADEEPSRIAACSPLSDKEPDAWLYRVEDDEGTRLYYDIRAIQDNLPRTAEKLKELSSVNCLDPELERKMFEEKCLEQWEKNGVYDMEAWIKDFVREAAEEIIRRERLIPTRDELTDCIRLGMITAEMRRGKEVEFSVSRQLKRHILKKIAERMSLTREGE